jgi:hypothetical protein
VRVGDREDGGESLFAIQEYEPWITPSLLRASEGRQSISLVENAVKSPSSPRRRSPKVMLNRSQHFVNIAEMTNHALRKRSREINILRNNHQSWEVQLLRLLIVRHAYIAINRL